MADPILPRLPDTLISAVVSQSAALFLGAGASFGAKHSSGKKIPSAAKLRDELSDKFLGGRLKEKNLSHVADISINESDFVAVQSFVRDQFIMYEPADYHLIIPRFFWHAIATTNYDLLIEKAFEKEKQNKQQLVIFTKNGQRIDTKMKSIQNGLRYIKLHGCIDHIEDTEIPLILAREQYARYYKNRDRLFKTFEQIGYEFTIIFCGYSLDDPHIQTILFDLTDLGINRPRYYFVSPNLDETETRYWEKHRITCIPSTFELFLKSLENTIPEAQRSIPPLIGGGTESIRKFFRVPNPSESEPLKLFLSSDVDHVRTGMATLGTNPKDFYIGADNTWGPIEANLDVRRRITDNIVVDAILTDEQDRRSLVDLHVLKGPAGHGKTTTLRRVAWEASTQYSKPCIFLREEGALIPQRMRELCELSQQRIYLFVDRAALRMYEIHGMIDAFLTSKMPLTIITAERDNEWNVRCGSLDEYVTQIYPLRNLSENEIRELLNRLETHDALGRLAALTYEQRVREFLVYAERQLLVALHEATLGKSFEEIVKDEFDRIVPSEAQTLYLDVCTLNRLGVPVRAGLISRVSGVRFSDFEERFLKPLEHVVKSYFDQYVGDRMYSARHPHIADMVFQLSLVNSEERYEQLVRIIEGMNIDYSSDHEAFRSLIRGRSIGELFSSYELGRRVYEQAKQMVGSDPHVLQQHAVFEMTHPGGSLATAEESLKRALEIAPYDKSIQHTWANLKRVQANDTGNSLLRSKLRRESRNYLKSLTGGDAKTSHGYYTLVLVLLDDLRELLQSKSGKTQFDLTEEKLIADAVKDIELLFRESQQKFPEEERLLEAESRFRDLLEQDGRAQDVLERAFNKNPRSEWIAVRLSRRFMDIGNVTEAREVLLKCASENPGGKGINFAIGRFYQLYGDTDEKSRVILHLRRSFTENDSNFDAQYWYARELFLAGEKDVSDKMFQRLAHSPVSPEVRNKIRGFVLDENREIRQFQSVIRRKEEAYFFADVEGFPQSVFCHASQAFDDDWGKLFVGKSVVLEIGFSMRGPAARLVS